MSDEQDKKTIPQLDLGDALKSKAAQGAISEREGRTAPTLAGESVDALTSESDTESPAADDDSKADSGEATLEDRIRAKMRGSGAHIRVDPMIGKVVGDRFEIISKLGTGGMGVVYKATQKGMDRFVAIKVLLKQYASNENVVRRFQREALAVSKLEHPNTVRIYDFGEMDDGTLYIAMEYLAGVSLAKMLTRQRQLSVRRTIQTVQLMCQSLGEAHEKGIIHRDLKPDNIFVSDPDDDEFRLKVLDFGVAKLREVREDTGTLTQHGTIFGTPKYMSPEQCRCSTVDARSDIYSVGIMMYEMLSGRVPFDSENPLAILIMHAQETIPPLSAVRPDLVIPFEVEEFLHRLLDKDPDARPRSTGEVASECQKLLHKLPEEFDACLTYQAAEEAGMDLSRSQAFTVPESGTQVVRSIQETQMVSDQSSDPTIALDFVPKFKKPIWKRLTIAALVGLVLIGGTLGYLYSRIDKLPGEYWRLMPQKFASTELPPVTPDLVTISVKTNKPQVSVVDVKTRAQLPRCTQDTDNKITCKWLKEENRMARIQLVAANAEPIERQIDLGRDQQLDDASFEVTTGEKQPETVNVQVQANVRDVRVQIGSSPLMYRILQGTAGDGVVRVPMGDEAVVLVFQKDGYQEVRQTITPMKAQSISLTMEKLETPTDRQQITLTVKMNVGKVRVSVEGSPDSFGTADKAGEPRDLTFKRGDGAIILVFKKRGYKTEKRDVTPDQDQTIDVSLVRLKGGKGGKGGKGTKGDKGNTASPVDTRPIKITPIKKPKPKPKPIRLKVSPIKGGKIR